MELDENIKLELEKVAKLSTTNFKFGSLIIKDGEIVSSGYAYKSAKGTEVEDENLLFIHAEESALMQALKNNIDIRGADIYVMGFNNSGEVKFTDYSYSCVVCSRLLKQSGIINVIYPAPEGWKKISTDKMFNQAINRVKEGKV